MREQKQGPGAGGRGPGKTKRRPEYRHGQHECVRHVLRERNELHFPGPWPLAPGPPRFC
jgi:hypothetical protein